MLHCEKCDIDVSGAPERCPLCQGRLTGEPDPLGGVFVPLEAERKKQSRVFSIVTMSALTIVVVSLGVDFLSSPGFRWSLFVSGGAVCGWLFAVIGWRKRNELAKNIFLQTTLVVVIGCLWDLAVGWTGWSLDYVIPCACVAAVLALCSLAVILQLRSSDFVPYLCMVALYGLVPFLFLCLDLVDVRYPSVICSAVCLLTMIALLLFFRRSTLEELKRKLHI